MIRDATKVCYWCLVQLQIRGEEYSPKQTKALANFVPPTGGFAPRGSSFRATGVPQWVSLQQLAIDVQTLASQIPSDTTAIVGVARSGIVPASMVALLLHLPLLSIRQTKGDVIDIGNGWRLGGQDHVSDRGKVVIVDDTVMTGNSLRATADLVRKEFSEATTAAIYVNPLAKAKPDVYVRDLGWPHLLEWNLFNSVLSPNMACDFDGILCRDCPRGSDDDGLKYIEFIRNAVPLYVPRKVPIPLVVTARLERYRSETMAWLERHRIKVDRLVMHPAATLAERNRDDIAAYKANHFAEWASTHIPRPAPIAFIESENWQAKRIAELTNRMVICPAAGEVYSGSS
jgi:adenine/guanine phosphoribosyltransferase-like PRPP-binding protein